MSKKIINITNSYAVTIVNHRGPLHVAADSFPKAYYKAIDLINSWDAPENYEVTDICLIGPILC